MSKTLKIALYGGSFDPPHIAHLEVVAQILEHLDIDRLFVLVAYQNPFKGAPCFSPKQRLAWMRGLLSGFSKVEVSDFEICAQRPVPSVESVLHFHHSLRPSKLYFVIGADNLAHLSQWEGYATMQELAEFVVVQREGYPLEPRLDSLYIPLPRIQERISSTQIKALLAQHKIPSHLPPTLQGGVIQAFKEIHV
ncbi:nicotinate (nicotinamide) nucleotide adenylyltransferase [Helicobacter cynogastricus]|uniref:nicotinate (nicotinamide) nucleotide adenylyltransferase n=1 Tax=Helicobacter cynogastricus TaxID=329937 RepID=UPI000CF082E0|nr:nicotinate (nicotinamide) nucleotide adenylyltransferase [Helicobacter cynogastricus]